MNCLKHGVSPATRHDGTNFTHHDARVRLPPGQALPRSALLQIRGDWEWLCQCFRFRHFSSESLCWQCQATQTGPMSYMDVRPTAAHRGTLISHEEYIRECIQARQQPSALFVCPGFRLEHVALDSMHCGDLGVFQDAIGGIFYVEVSNRDWYQSFGVGVQALNKQLRDYFAANPHLSRIHLTMNMIKDKKTGVPSLKSKAAECRHLSGFCLMLAHKHAAGSATRRALTFREERLQPYSEEYRHLIVGLASNLHHYHETCSQEPFDCIDCKRAMYGFLQSMSDLRLLFRRHLPAERHGQMPFPFRPKAHQLQHLVEDKIPLWLSPKNFWCYSDEDFVGLMKRICTMTKHPASMERVLLDKFRLFAGLNALAHREQP